MPLPPYIHTALDDPERYQTVFADEPASAARRPPGCTSPTTSSPPSGSDIATATVELVVGLDTFAPITEATR